MQILFVFFFKKVFSSEETISLEKGYNKWGKLTEILQWHKANMAPGRITSSGKSLRKT